MVATAVHGSCPLSRRELITQTADSPWDVPDTVASAASEDAVRTSGGRRGTSSGLPAREAVVTLGKSTRAAVPDGWWGTAAPNAAPSDGTPTAQRSAAISRNALTGQKVQPA